MLRILIAVPREAPAQHRAFAVPLWRTLSPSSPRPLRGLVISLPPLPRILVGRSHQGRPPSGMESSQLSEPAEPALWLRSWRPLHRLRRARKGSPRLAPPDEPPPTPGAA